MFPSAPIRAIAGFFAAALSVLIFHQGMVEVLHVLDFPGLPVAQAWQLAPVPPLSIPRLLDLCFWGGLYGIAFGLASPVFSRPLWPAGLLFGLLAVLVGFFVVAPLKGAAAGGDWLWTSWVRSLLINGAWGFGLGLLYPVLQPRGARNRHRHA